MANTATAIAVQTGTAMGLEEAAVKLAILRAQLKGLNERIKSVESNMKAEMENAELENAEAAGHTFYYKACTRNSFDSKAYAEVHPRVAARYAKQASCMKLTVSEAK